MVKYIQNLLLYWQFRRALKKCDKINRRNGNVNKSFVANICGKPYIIDRKSFRSLRMKKVFRHDLKWCDVCAKCVTDKTIKQWIS